jgi:hypothetical protein
MIRLILLLTLITSSFQVLGNSALFERTQKISLIFVGPAKGISESSFGHVALRLSQFETPSIQDAVVEFVADIPDGERAVKKYIRGIGMGLGYPVLADLKPFYDYKKIKTIIENRDLEVFELKLSKDEIQKVVNFIINFQTDLTPEEYAFFSKNCSYFSALALEKALGDKIPFKSLPWKVPKKLKKMDLVSHEEFYPAASLERMRYAQGALDKDNIALSFPDPNWKSSFVSMLGEYEFVLRQSSYLKLLWVLSDESSTLATKKRIEALIRYLVSLEPDGVKFALKNLFSDVMNKKVVAPPLVRGNISLPKDRSKIKHQLMIKKDQVVLEISWSGMRAARHREQSRVVRVKKDLVLHDLVYNPKTSAISFNGIHLGRKIGLKKSEIILTQALDYGFEIDDENKLIRPYLYIDYSEKLISPKYSFGPLKDKGIMALNNAIDFKGEMGSCYAMVLLQKSLVEKAFFLPHLDKADGKVITTLNEVFAGNFAFIPGFKNIQEFTASIDKAELKAFIREKQRSLEKSPLMQMLENVRLRRELDENTIHDFKSLINEGVSVPLIVGMYEKNKNKLASSAGHVILVFDIVKEKEGSYRLTAYDPNTGMNTLFILNQDYTLQYPFYDKNYDYKGVIDHLEADPISLDHAVRSRRMNFGILEMILRTGNPLIIPPFQVFKMLD